MQTLVSSSMCCKAFMLGARLWPSSASALYFRDEIGNVSTSAVRRLRDKLEVRMQPRFPLFGGWQVRAIPAAAEAQRVALCACHCTLAAASSCLPLPAALLVQLLRGSACTCAPEGYSQRRGPLPVSCQ